MYWTINIDGKLTYIWDKEALQMYYIDTAGVCSKTKVTLGELLRFNPYAEVDTKVNETPPVLKEYLNNIR